MNLREFQQYVPTTMNDLGSKINNEVHMMLGAGSELMAELPKGIDRKDKVNIGEELGDTEWFLCNYANIWGIVLPEIIPFPNGPGSLPQLLKIVGTMMDITKREFAYGKAQYNKQDVTIELREGLLIDAFREIKKLAKEHKINMAEVRDKIKLKLSARYGIGAGFSQEKALNRDTAAEREALS